MELLVAKHPIVGRCADFLENEFKFKEFVTIAEALRKMTLMEFKVLCAAFDQLNAFAFEGATTHSVAQHLYNISDVGVWEADIDCFLAEVSKLILKVSQNDYWTRIGKSRGLENTMNTIATSIACDKANAPKINKLVRYLLVIYTQVLGHKI